MDFWVPVITFVLGFFADKILDYTYSNVKTIKTKLKVKKALEKMNTSADALGILTIASGFHNFNSKKLRTISLEDKELYLGFPHGLNGADTIPEGFSEYDKIDFPIALSGYTAEQTAAMLQKAKVKIAEEFLARKNGLYFNGKLYGVSYADGFSRTADESEQPILKICLFKTDYYTHRVMAEVLHQAKNDLKDLSVHDLNQSYAPFRTSLGLSVVVVLSSTNQIIMTKRNRYASYSEGIEWIYVSVTETFSTTDYDGYTRTPDVLFCIQRGLSEELGIPSEFFMDGQINIYDMFYEKTLFQDNITASVTLKEEITFDDILPLLAKDKAMEIDNMFLIDNSKTAIESFIKENSAQMRPQTIYTLHSHMARL